MTKKLKLFLSLLFTCSIFLNSCDKDFDEDISSSKNAESNNTNLKVSKVYFKDFKNNTKLLNKIKKTISEPKSSLNSRAIHSSDNNFYIETDFAYFIKDEKGNHSYTFKIERNNSEYLLENLILNSNNQNSYDVFIAQYNITEQEYEELEHGHNPNLSSKIVLTPVSGTIIDVNSIFARGSVEEMCLTTTIIPGNTCPGPEHHTLDDVLSGANCPYFSSGNFTLYREQVIYSWGPCGEEEGGGGDYDNGDNPYSGGSNEGTGGTSNNNDNPENTDPNQNEDIEDTQNPVNTTPVVITIAAPCDELNKLTSNPDPTKNNHPAMEIGVDKHIRTAIINMPNEVNSNNENGYAFLNPANTPYNPFANYVVPPQGIAKEMQFQPSRYMFGVIHTHRNDGIAIPMFSLSDIFSLLKISEGYEFNNNDRNRNNPLGVII